MAKKPSLNVCKVVCTQARQELYSADKIVRRLEESRDSSRKEAISATMRDFYAGQLIVANTKQKAMARLVENYCDAEDTPEQCSSTD